MSERRRQDRVDLGPEYTLRFVVKGHSFQGVRLANLSIGGCFLLVPRASAGLFQTGTLLEQIRFEGDGLPEGQLTGAVAYALASSPHLAVVGVGVLFVQLTAAVEEHLGAFIASRMVG